MKRRREDSTPQVQEGFDGTVMGGARERGYDVDGEEEAALIGFKNLVDFYSWGYIRLAVSRPPCG